LSSKVNRRRFLKYAGAGLAAGAAAIGGYYFYQSSTPAPAPACESPSCWTYVALGDSWTGNICGGKSYVDYYADYIKSDLGVKVRVLNKWKADLTTDELLSALRGDQGLRNEISEAKVVTFLIGGNSVEGIVVNPGVTDIRKALAPWREIYDAVIDEILSLRSTSDTIIRAITEANPWVSYLKKQGILDQVKPNLAGYVEQTVEAASQHNIPVARVDLAWNGPNLDEDPAAKGYTCGDVSELMSSVHPNEAGNRVIADVLRKLGYKPLGP
jgi:lysophospholipase L1-like esterase